MKEFPPMSAFEFKSYALPVPHIRALNCIRNAEPKLFAGDVFHRLHFEYGNSEELTVSIAESDILICAGTLNSFLRGMGCAMAGVEVRERIPFSSLGLMLDCSRNRVFKVEFIKKLLVKLALNGYNRLMLYTEDVYELPGEPAFGYMRGRYSADEIREIARFASELGIELSACIQTLGHLEHVFTHFQYLDILDKNGILLADEDKTYELIEKMIRFWTGILPSKKLHIGMDEAHDLGRGRHLDQYGFEPPRQIYLRHLKRVCALCEKYGVTPVIWSDMLLSFPDPEALRVSLPENLELCYWNYGGMFPEVYEKGFEQHRVWNRPLTMASAVYSYNTFCWFAEKSEKVIPACIAACRKTGIKDIFFTLWGDAGAFCNFDSALAGISFAASAVYGEDSGDASVTSALYQVLCSEDYALHREASKLHRLYGTCVVPTPGLLWQDPLQGSCSGVCYAKYPEIMKDYRVQLEAAAEKLASVPLSESLQEICSVMVLLLALLSLRDQLLKSYFDGDKKNLKILSRQDIPSAIEKVKIFDAAFRKEWLRSAKPFGLEIIQRRNAGLITRLNEIAVRIEEYLNDSVACIEELDEILQTTVTPDFYTSIPVFSSCLEIY